MFFCAFPVFMLLSHARYASLVIHKTPTSTPDVMFPQLRHDDAPHLLERVPVHKKKVGIYFLFLFAYLKMAGAARRALQNWLLMWWEKGNNNWLNITYGGAVVNRLRRRTSDQTVLGSNPAVAAALSPWTRLFTPIVPRRSLRISFY